MAITELQIEETNNKINEAREAIEAKSVELMQKLTQIQQIGQCEQLSLAEEALRQTAENEKRKLLEAIPEESTFNSRRTFPNVHGMSNIMYQKVERNKTHQIVKYGDIMVKGLVHALLGSGIYSTSVAFATPWLRVNIPDGVEIAEVYGDGVTCVGITKERDYIYVWGRQARPGDNDNYYLFTPWRTNFPQKIKKVLMGKITRHNTNVFCDPCIVIILDNGQVWSWGCNRTGQLGIGDSSTLAVFKTWQLVQMPVGHKPIDGSLAHSGRYGFCILITEKDGKRGLVGWGNNECGQLGLGTTQTLYHPQELKMPEGLHDRQVFKVWTFSQTYSKSTHIACSFITIGTDESDTVLYCAGYNQNLTLTYGGGIKNSWVICSGVDTVGPVKNITNIVGSPYKGPMFALKSDHSILVSGYVPCKMGQVMDTSKAEQWRYFDPKLKASAIKFVWHTNNYDNQNNIYPTFYFKNLADNVWYHSGYDWSAGYSDSSGPTALEGSYNYEKVPGFEELSPLNDDLCFSTVDATSYSDHGYGFAIYTHSYSERYIVARCPNHQNFPIFAKLPWFSPVPGTYEN